jgi:hypothetical protein
MNDSNNIYKLYIESNASQTPQMHENRYGVKIWQIQDKLHREDGPAIITPDGSELWFQNDKLHREDGKAVNITPYFAGVIVHNAQGKRTAWFVVDDFEGNEFWLHDRPYADANKWAQVVLKMHNKPHDAAHINEFLRDILTKDDLI